MNIIGGKILRRSIAIFGPEIALKFNASNTNDPHFLTRTATAFYPCLFSDFVRTVSAVQQYDDRIEASGTIHYEMEKIIFFPESFFGHTKNNSASNVLKIVVTILGKIKLI